MMDHMAPPSSQFIGMTFESKRKFYSFNGENTPETIRKQWNYATALQDAGHVVSVTARTPAHREKLRKYFPSTMIINLYVTPQKQRRSKAN